MRRFPTSAIRSTRPRPAPRALRRTAAALALLAPLASPLAAAPSPSGLDLAGMDRSVRPGDDFYFHANGAWDRRTEIPADRSSWGVFAMLREEADRRTADLVREAAAGKAADGADARRVGDFFAAWMDEAAIEKRGLAPAREELAAIAAIADRTALARVLGASLRADVDALNATDFETDRIFGVWVSPSFDDPSRNVAYLLQGGLGLPDRDNYTSQDPHDVAIQEAYRRHVATVLRLGGFDRPEERAAAIWELERKIAAVHATRTESVDVHRANNPWKREELPAKAPGIDWPALLAAAGLADQPVLVVWHPGAVTGIARLVGSEPLATWKDWLAYHALDRRSPVLPRAFAAEHFAFHGKVLTGAEVERERWKRAVDATNEALGDAVGRLYVARWFPPSAKAQVEAMVKNLLAAFATRIDRLDWMAPATRAQAKAKVAALRVGIGYPGRWRDDSGLEIRRDDAFGNVERAELYAYRDALRRLHEPVDRDQWWMTPQTVNAVNLPLQNALNFPAAILQPPFFDPAADPAVNYGGIGTVIGHEISHSFDDQGSQFDEHGALRNWWTPQDLAHFEAAGARLVAQYDAYEPLPGLHLNGRLTLSENIADVAGVAASHDAWLGSLASLGGKPAPELDGFTGDQRFFLSFAQIWRSKYREPALRNLVRTNGHSPGRWRAATVRNVDEWYGAFGVEPGQKLYLAPAERVRIW